MGLGCETYFTLASFQGQFVSKRTERRKRDLVLIVSGRGWNYVGVAIAIVNCTVKHAVKHTVK